MASYYAFELQLTQSYLRDRCNDFCKLLYTKDSGRGHLSPLKIPAFT
ncbi:hypothetical protein IQ230_14110 [Gloeocapsopsis crepidinum LEGE 06123]|uniref:Transposase n=1 Tax=Gloeocapsopsis crepidinum LEGE 06123 TaxID=588587 RepID=A0ABR9UT41_9CHRO|nr:MULTISPECIES: hypothetical protein [Gloeocapsopsis]MBE9191461.1 hypothetical protein [Gloeocapsopsis crepidinum LEGE 06123]